MSAGVQVALVGCGRLGSAILEGWLASGTVTAADVIIFTPSAKPAAERALEAGARINPPIQCLANVDALVLAVKPAAWRDALAPLVHGLGPDAAIVSVMAGVRAADISAVSNRCVVRVMPTTAVAQARGVAALWSEHAPARASARRLFERIAEVVDLGEEDQMDAATAVAGSAPAFIYAFVETLALAGEREGLPLDAARRLATGALRSAGAGLETEDGLDALIARIASPGGTTRAGLDAAANDLTRAANTAVSAAVDRARSLQRRE